MLSSISFPLGVAEGHYFCNRKNEIKQLIHNIQNGTHTVLISPRRYGKTSLAYKAIKESKLSNSRVDLYMTTNAIEIEKAIISGVNHLLSGISNKPELLLGLIKDYIKLLRPFFEASKKGLMIKLERKEKSASSADNIREALQIVDSVLKKKSISGILLIDEFQEIQRIAPDQGIEGAIRNVLQETKNLTAIISGSHRHLLKNMFNDRSKPLYRLCDEIQLERISEKDYLPFVDKFAVKQWGNELPKSVSQKILELSECHAYYFNAICEKLFMHKKLPTEQIVKEIWNNLIVIKRKDLLRETKELNITHKKILVAIAHGIDRELTGHKFLAQSGLPGSSVIRAIKYLEENDFIEKREDCYRLIDPLLKSIINELTYF